MTSRTARRAEALAALAGEVRRLIRDAIGQPQGELFHQARATREAREARVTITMSVREASELVRAALPTSGRDTTARLRHALLVISLRHCLDTVRAIEADTATPEAIAAAKIAGKELRTWLRSVEKPKVKRSSARPVPKQGRLLLPIAARPREALNIITISRHEATPLHNLDSLRSQADPAPLSEETNLSQSGTTGNEIKRPKRRTA
jgi:hypothetical protein